MGRLLLPAFVCLGALCVGASAQNASPSAELDRGWMRPGPTHKVFVDADDERGEQLVRDSGAVLHEVDYGSFSLFVVDERTFGGRGALRLSGLAMRDEHDLIPLNGYLLDGLRPDDTLARLHPEELLGPGLDAGAGLYLVQFVGPVRDEWLGWLSAIGARVVQYVPMNAYVVALAPDAVERLQDLVSRAPEVQYAGVWQPAFRLTPDIRRAAATAAGSPRSVTIQLVRGDGQGLQQALQAIEGWAVSVGPSEVVGSYENVAAELDPAWFRLLARHPAVFAIEARGTPERCDEIQGQVVAGNVNAFGPSSAGYLSWLASVGFDASQFGSFAINVVDDATSLRGHPDLHSSRIAFEANPTGQGGALRGHGFFNAHIIAGFNDGAGPAYEDTNLYNYGLGIAPWARVGSTAIFGPDGAASYAWEREAYQRGARISSNSWRYVDAFAQPITAYDSSAQTFDHLVRDAVSSAEGNQEYTVVFAAGNDGPDTNTVGSPGTAKNVITVGASENRRATGTDGCGVDAEGADQIHDVADFSSRGPVAAAGGDGRWKPEILAPGTHIQAGVPQGGGYSGAGLCDTYQPQGQTLYTWSSGTSHATPAVAGGAALVRQWFLNQGFSAPSPAMTKALLVNGAAYMTGVDANDTLPSNAQGMGRMNLGPVFDGGVERLLVDQSELLSATGEVHVATGTVADPEEPFRVTLVWTDAPGSTTGAPWVNDLDLRVDIGGKTYRGNVFSGRHSVAGGSHDLRNNTESVFLPAGTSGPFTVTVTARGLHGDGVPGNGDGTDQDFALVVHNAAPVALPDPPVAAFGASPLTGTEPHQVQFTDLSGGEVTSWSWDFGDGGTSTSPDPSHTYTSPGSFTVSLAVSGPGGSDVETRIDVIRVEAAPVSGPVDGSFEGQVTAGPPGSPWAVYFGGGHLVSPSGAASDGAMPSHGSRWCEIGADGTYAARPPSSPGGVTDPPIGGAGIYQDFTYATGSTTLSFDAVFLRHEAPGSPRNDWMSIDVTDGAKTVNLFYKDGLSETAGSSSQYGYAMTPLQTVSVDLASLYPSSTPSTTFRLTALVGNGLDGTGHSKGYIDNVRMGRGADAPSAAFAATSVTSGPAPLTVVFDDLSTGAVAGHSWDFGDGGVSTLANPEHTYATPGTYSVTLTVTGRGGSDVATRADYVTVLPPLALPEADFQGTPTTGVVPLEVAFTDLSSGGEVTAWSWDFGDGGTSTAPDPTHTYTAPGSYTVSLTVSGPDGGDVVTKVGYVHVEAEPASGPADGSFEGQREGGPPVAPWAVYFGSGHLVSPSGAASDGAMPSHGSRWCEIGADGTYAARPPSSPGGVTAPPVGGAGIYQDFNYTEGRTTLSFDAVFLRHEVPGSPRNDWMSVDITDGTTTVNLFYADGFSATAGSSGKYGHAMTPLQTVVVDLAGLYPASKPSTTFRLTALVGNGLDGSLPSRGYIDNVRMGP